MPADRALIDAIRADLRVAADPAIAPGMRAYMKSAMPFLGVRAPQVRMIAKARARELPFRDAATVVDSVRALWHKAAHREERYAATTLLDVPPARRLRTASLIGLHEELIVDGAWWDHVDELARRVGELRLAFPAEITPVLVRWQREPDRWLRRVSIIGQLGQTTETDLALLTDAIEANLDDRDFFLRKAIGWALREYARTGPDWVQRFVATHPLQPLSLREATKHLGPDSVV